MIRLLIFCAVAWHLSAASVTYRVQVARSGHLETIELKGEEYVEAVLAGESSTFDSVEGLKAMAVAIRTYAARMKRRHSAEGFDFCSTTHCQRLELVGARDRFRDVTRSTAGQILWYEGLPAYAVYSRDCGGVSEDAGALWPDLRAPYLRTHADQYCLRHGASSWGWTGQLDDIARALRHEGLECPQPLQHVTVAKRAASGRAQVLKLENQTTRVNISADSFRLALGRTLGWNGIRSNRYEITALTQAVHFQGSGQGHGVGLCQQGADEMGREGKSVEEILAYYYPGTVIGTSARGLVWQKVTGEGVTILTTNSNRDGSLVRLSESVKASVHQRLGLPLPDAINVRVYPSVEVFRNATGEPGWVAARSYGATVDLQPEDVLRTRGVLRPILYHEFVHLAIENGAHRDLPLWFREGLVECLASNGQNQTITLNAKADDHSLRQRDSEAEARNGYRASRMRVSLLLRTYGEGTVLGWVRTGLPDAVMNSIASSERTNSR